MMGNQPTKLGALATGEGEEAGPIKQALRDLHMSLEKVYLIAEALESKMSPVLSESPEKVPAVVTEPPVCRLQNEIFAIKYNVDCFEAQLRSLSERIML
jgi:hypothetical protein